MGHFCHGNLLYRETTIKFLPMIRRLFDIIIVVSTEKAWLNFPVKVEMLDCARSNQKSQLELFP